MYAKIKNATKLITFMSIKGVVITDAPKIESCVVNHYKCLFKILTILQENVLVEEIIPTSILDLLSNIEIKDAMWSLNMAMLHM